jgi:hypothetical protein
MKRNLLRLEEIQWLNHGGDGGIVACLVKSAIIPLSGYLLYSYMEYTN